MNIYSNIKLIFIALTCTSAISATVQQITVKYDIAGLICNSISTFYKTVLFIMNMQFIFENVWKCGVQKKKKENTRREYKKSFSTQ